MTNQSNVNRNLRKEMRRHEAEDRAKERAERSDAEQLFALEKSGYGDCKEAKRLRTKLYNKLAMTPSRES